MKENIDKLKAEYSKSTAQELLAFFLKEFGSGIKLASSLGAEDQVLTDMVLKIKPDAEIFIIDTGRLNQETYDTAQKTMENYSMKYQVYFPECSEIEKLVRDYGPNLFYQGIDFRKQCCSVRKVAPLKRALGDCSAWITGLRSGQSVTRAGLTNIEWDESFGIIKLNPLADWTSEMVWEYIEKNNVPYNSLHDKGYPSIGCAPCTRAVKEGEDIRAGRWWWESPEQKECGLHTYGKKTG